MFVAELEQRSVNVHVRVMMIGHVPLVSSTKFVATGPQLSVAVTLAGAGTWTRHWKDWLVGAPMITGGVVALSVTRGAGSQLSIAVTTGEGTWGRHSKVSSVGTPTRTGGVWSRQMACATGGIRSFNCAVSDAELLVRMKTVLEKKHSVLK